MAVLRRSLFPWPTFKDASSEVVDLVRRSEAHLAATPADAGGKILSWLREDPLSGSPDYPLDLGLTHRLAPWFAARQKGAAPTGRSLREWAVLDRFGDRLIETLAHPDPTDFARGLATLATHCEGRPIQPRGRAIGTESDSEGNRVVFPPSGLIRERLTMIHHQLGSAEAPAIYRAAVAMAAISNCHPFDDGNGRTSRMLFNAVMRRGSGRKDLYAPLQEFAALSGGSLTLAVREAELHDRWEPLFGFVERALFLVASGSLRPADWSQG
jgi:hypothetical protein